MPTFNLTGVSATGSAGGGTSSISKSISGVSASGHVGSLLPNSSPSGPTFHQSFTQFLYLGSRFVDPENGLIEPPWDRFLTDLWLRTGGANSNTNLAYLKVDGSNIYAVRLADGVAIQLATIP